MSVCALSASRLHNHSDSIDLKGFPSSTLHLHPHLKLPFRYPRCLWIAVASTGDVKRASFWWHQSWLVKMTKCPPGMQWFIVFSSYCQQFFFGDHFVIWPGLSTHAFLNREKIIVMSTMGCRLYFLLSYIHAKHLLSILKSLNCYSSDNFHGNCE